MRTKPARTSWLRHDAAIFNITKAGLMSIAETPTQITNLFTLDKFRDRDMLSGDVVVLANGPNVIGWGRLVNDTIEDLWIDAVYQHQGHGTRILNELEQLACAYVFFKYF
jgi:hypothetical protein